MDPDFGEHHTHAGYHGVPGAHGVFDWLPLLPGALLILLIVVWMLLSGGAFGPNPLAAALRRAPDPLRGRWEAAVRAHASTARDYAAYECDPGAALRLPDLANVACPATARFVDAFAEAVALATDDYPGAGHAERFAAAADRAHRAWRAALDAAERSQAARFAPEERSLLTQVVALLAVARDSALDGERHAAYRQARRRLAELERRTGWTLPKRAAIVLEQRGRGALPPAEPAGAA